MLRPPRHVGSGVAACLARAVGGLLSLSLALTGIAEAADADMIARRVATLRQQIDNSGRGDVSRRAQARFDEAVYLGLIAEWTDAARMFWLLREDGAFKGDPAASAALDWSLADALIQAGLPSVAVEVLTAVAADVQHPFRRQAVSRLLSLYVDEGDGAAFDALYRAEVLKGGTAVDPAILFQVGRLLRKRGDTDTAAGYFREFGPDSSQYLEAQYHLGAMAIARGGDADFEVAAQHFRTIIDHVATVGSKGDDLVLVDLAWLGIARIHQARRELLQALEAYVEVSPGSPYRPHQLYEIVWVFSRAERWDDAAFAVAQFLSAFPEHPWADELRLVEGHLAYRDGQVYAAINRYGEITAALEPLAKRFRELAASRDDAQLTYTTLRTEGSAAVRSLPPDGVALALRDAAFQRAVDLGKSVTEQEASLSEAEALIEMVDGAVGVAGTAEAIRLGLVATAVDALAVRVSSLEQEQAWLKERAADALGMALTDLANRTSSARLEAIRIQGALTAARTEGAAQGGPALERAEGEILRDALALDDRLRGIVATQRSAREGAGRAVVEDPKAAGFDVTHRRLDSAVDDLDALAVPARGLTAPAKADLLARYHEERGRVADERVRLDRLTAEVQVLGTGAAIAAFRRAQASVDATIMGADMGIVNIYWTRWVDAGDQTLRVKKERNELISALESRYDLIRQSMGR